MTNTNASSFVTQTSKPSGAQYLEATLVEVIDRANNSKYESEIPFVSAVLAAKANRDQRLASQQTFYTALASLFVAILSLISTVIIFTAQSQQEDALKSKLANLTTKHDELNKQLELSKIEQKRFSEQLVSLSHLKASATSPAK